MQGLRWRKFIFSSIISVLWASAVALPVFAEDDDQSMRELTGATEAWGQDLQEKVAAQMQQAMSEEIVLQYEIQLAQQIADDMEQLALAVSIDPEPVISAEADEMLAVADTPGEIETECDY